GLHRVCIHAVADLLTVGRDVVVIAAAEGEGRHVANSGREVADGAASGRDDHQVAAALALPTGPVTVEQFRVDPRLDLAGLFRIENLPVTGIVRGAFGIDRAGEDEVLA